MNPTTLSSLTTQSGTGQNYRGLDQPKQSFFPTGTVVGGVPTHTANDGACTSSPFRGPGRRKKYMRVYNRTLTAHPHTYDDTGSVDDVSVVDSASYVKHASANGESLWCRWSSNWSVTLVCFGASSPQPLVIRLPTLISFYALLLHHLSLPQVGSKRPDSKTWV